MFSSWNYDAWQSWLCVLSLAWVRAWSFQLSCVLGWCMEHMWVLACVNMVVAVAMPMLLLSWLLWMLLAIACTAAAAGAIVGTGKSASLAASGSWMISGMSTSQVGSAKKMTYVRDMDEKLMHNLRVCACEECICESHACDFICSCLCMMAIPLLAEAVEAEELAASDLRGACKIEACLSSGRCMALPRILLQTCTGWMKKSPLLSLMHACKITPEATHFWKSCECMSLQRHLVIPDVSSWGIAWWLWHLLFHCFCIAKASKGRCHAHMNMHGYWNISCMGLWNLPLGNITWTWCMQTWCETLHVVTCTQEDARYIC